MTKRTPLYEKHLQAGGKIVDFAGWEMPIHYGSQLDEHHHVRQASGMFDVSHMTICDLHGSGVKSFLRKLLANNIDKLKQPGKALYCCMLNEQAGVIDDLIVYYMDDSWFRMVVNAATHDKDLAWMQQQSTAYDVSIEERPELAMIAVQGPLAREHAHQALGSAAQAAQSLNTFFAADTPDYFIARTGYTGEDGYEIMVHEKNSAHLWDALLQAGVKPIGLGARDTLRLEAGMNLYGQDMDESTSPLESALGWTIGWEPNERAFIGREVLETQRAEGVTRKLVGLVLQERGVMRSHQKVVLDDGSEGETTSGSYSPTLGQSISFARVPAHASDSCKVEIRNKLINAKIVKPPFVRNGKSCL